MIAGEEARETGDRQGVRGQETRDGQDRFDA